MTNTTCRVALFLTSGRLFPPGFIKYSESEPDGMHGKYKIRNMYTRLKRLPAMFCACLVFKSHLTYILTISSLRTRESMHGVSKEVRL